MRPVIVPAILTDTFADIEDSVVLLSGLAREIQIDVVDGDYAPRTTWPFHSDSAKAEWGKLALLQKDLVFELDLMVREPKQYFPLLKEKGFNRLILHYGSTDSLKETLESARRMRFQVGLAITNDNSLDDASDYFELVDWIQVMGIKEVGEQGQEFDDRTFSTIATIINHDNNLVVAVDGAVNEETIHDLLRVGARRLCVGSAIFKASNPAEAYKQLQNIVRV